MAPSRRRAVAATAVVAVVMALVSASSAFGADQRVVKARDDCDPVTFNAAGIPCVGAGRTIHFVNEGGEAHTFTMVPKFGNGCVDALNPVPGPPAVDCATIVPILPGGTADITVGQAPTVLFQCMIHPWMRSTVDVRDRGNRGED